MDRILSSCRSALSSGVRFVHGMSKKSGPAVALFSCRLNQRLQFTKQWMHEKCKGQNESQSNYVNKLSAMQRGTQDGTDISASSGIGCSIIIGSVRVTIQA